MIFIIRFPVFLNRRDQMLIITILCNRQTDTDGFLFICTCNYILGSCTGALFCTRQPFWSIRPTPGYYFHILPILQFYFIWKKTHSSFINKQQQKIHLNYLKKQVNQMFQHSVAAFLLPKSYEFRWIYVHWLLMMLYRMESNAGCLLGVFTLKIVKIKTNEKLIFIILNREK